MTVTLSPRPGYPTGNHLTTSTANAGVPTLYATYVRGKGKRTYLRACLTPDWSEAFKIKVGQPRGDEAVMIRYDAAVGSDAPASFTSTERDEFERRAEARRAESRMADALELVGLIPLDAEIDCGLDEGLALALRDAWNKTRSAEGRPGLMRSFELFAGKPERYIFRVYGTR